MYSTSSGVAATIAANGHHHHHHSSGMQLSYELSGRRDIVGMKNVQQGQISSDGYISYMIDGRQVKIVDNESQLVVATFNSPSEISSCCYYTNSNNNNNSETLCCFSKERELFVLDVSSGRKLRHFHLDYQIINCLTVDNYILVLTSDGIGLMNQEFQIEQHFPLNNPTSIYYCKDKDLIIVGFESGKIIFFKILQNLLEKVFTQQLCNDNITSISINNIGKQHDFTLLVGTEANELVLFYFVDYFKSYHSKQSIDLTSTSSYSSQQQLLLKQVKLVTIDKYSSLVLLQDGNNKVQLLVFNLNIWISSGKQFETSLSRLDIENLSCNMVLDVHINENIQYESNNLTRLEIDILTNQSIRSMTMKSTNILLSMVEINPSLQKLLNQTYNTGISSVHDLFNELYSNNLITVLVEYIEGTISNNNQEDLILPFNNNLLLSTNIEKRFIIHDIKDITSWIKHTQELEFIELENNLQKLLELTNRTIPPLVLLESKQVLQKSIHKLETLCLLIQSIIRRAQLMENVSDNYTPNLLKYKETIKLKVEHGKIMIWLMENGLLPMTSNIYNLNQLQNDWNQRKLQPFPFHKINITEDEFNSILNILNLSGVDSDMVPTLSNTTSTKKNFLIENLIEKCHQVEYPPKDLKQFISQVFNSQLSLEFKHLIIFYLIIDNYSSMDGGNEQTTISKLNNYAKEFNISAPHQHFIFGLWLLDTKRTQDSILNQAIHYISNLFINHHHNQSSSSSADLNEWATSILIILIKSFSFNAAQRLLNILTDSSSSQQQQPYNASSSDSMMDTTTTSMLSVTNKKYSIDSNIQVLVYLTNDMYHLAFDFCRSIDKEDERRSVFYCILYYSLIGNCFIDLLSTFPFDEMESLWIEQYLKQEKKHELLLSYYILNSNYVDAYHLSLQFNNSNYLSIIGNILPPIQKIKLDQQTSNMAVDIGDIKKNLLLKMGGRRINQQPIFTKNSGNQLKVISQLTSFRSWLDQHDKSSSFTIPSLFDAVSPKWIGKHRKHLLPNIEKQDLLYLPQNKMQIPVKMVDEDEEEDDSSSITSSSSSENEMGVVTQQKTVVPPTKHDSIPPRSTIQYGQKTVRAAQSRPATVQEEAVSTSGSESYEDEEEEEVEQSLMVQRLDYNKFKQVEPQAFRKENIFEEESNTSEYDDEEYDDEEEGEEKEEFVISD